VAKSYHGKGWDLLRRKGKETTKRGERAYEKIFGVKRENVPNLKGLGGGKAH